MRRALDLEQHVVLILTRHRGEASCLTELRLGASAPPHTREHLDRARRVDAAGGDDEGFPQRNRERARSQSFDAKLSAAQYVHATLSYGSSMSSSRCSRSGCRALLSLPTSPGRVFVASCSSPATVGARDS